MSAINKILVLAIEVWGALFCLIVSLTIMMTRHLDRSGSFKLLLAMLCSAALMISSGAQIVCDGNTSNAGLLVERYATFAVNFLSFLMIPLSSQYVSDIIYKRTNGIELYWGVVQWGLFGAGSILLIVNEFFPFMYTFSKSGQYVRLPIFYVIPSVIGVIGILTTLVVAASYRQYLTNLEKAAIISFLTLPLAGIIVKFFFPEIPVVTMSIVISAIILFVSRERNYMEMLVEQKKDIDREKLKLINRQMKPHFIFNTLTLIRFQCLTAPEEAAQTVTEFSNYLRGITDFLTEENCISVEMELNIVRNYLDIQSKRFGGDIKFAYELEDTDFEVPPFAVQTLVENAIHHGFSDGQTENGLVRITTKHDGKNHLVIIEDNGVGFDVNKVEKEYRNTVGISNTRNRVEIMCGGKLNVESTPGKGTKATIVIPD